MMITPHWLQLLSVCLTRRRTFGVPERGEVWQVDFGGLPKQACEQRLILKPSDGMVSET